jgi:hypothetical protein
MSNFKAFKTVIAAQFERMQKHPLFRVTVEKDDLWAMYLTSFPAGSNPIYRKRAEHDCSCCKHFIRNMGDVVAVIDGRVVNLWDVKLPNEPAYQVVADALSELIQPLAIRDKFLNYERSAGTDKNFEQLAGEIKTWDHFFVNIDKQFVLKKADIPTALAEPRESKNVLLRSLTEITDEAIDTALELIAQDSLYRGAEHKFAIESFRTLKCAFNRLKTDADRDVFAWINSATVGSVARIRNTVIGTLLVDISGDVDLDIAVKAFESKVAPANYKRPTALVTKAMVESAKRTVEELGLTSALKRRYATIHDITVNNIVFANRNARRAIDGDVFSELTTASTKPKNLDKIEEVGIDKFLADILPGAESIEIMVENRHASNFVSLIAPDDPTASEMFKWSNRFSWSYNGEMADSIRERVKAAGGSVVGDLCCRLAWEYTDDLDFHMHEPGGSHISFSQYRRALSPCGGMLDLDANGADGQRDDPAENIFYTDRKRMREGEYVLSVHNYNRRSSGKGFAVEIEFDGQVHQIAYDRVLRTGEHVAVAKIRYSHKGGFEIIESLPSSQISREVWGLSTQAFHPVNVLMLSPNYWDDRSVGNKHYFFMIDGCRNSGTARGFFNEFLKADLDKHRKVLEMVGSKVKVEGSDEQLSGMGFSSTMRNSVVCRVKGNFTRTIKITF